MSATIRVYVEGPNAALDTYTSIRLYRDTDPGGAFSTLVDTEPLVADTYEYLIEDPSGGSTSWYRFTFYNATGPVESEQSPPFRAGVTLAWLRVEAATRAGAGFRSTATGGTTTTLVDSALVDQGVDEHFLEGAWFYRPAATAANRVRRSGVAPFNTTTGSIGLRRTWTAPANGEEYHCFNLMPPIDQPGVVGSWDRAVRLGLERLRFPDLIFLGEGDGGTTRFSLDTHSSQVSERNIQRVFLRREDSEERIIETDAGKQGRWWEVVENTPDNLTLVLSHPPLVGETVVVEALVKDAALYRDDDTTLIAPERAIRAAVYEAYMTLNAREPGRYAAELAIARDRLNERERAEEAASYVRLV